jgi:hypothetical protein
MSAPQSTEKPQIKAYPWCRLSRVLLAVLGKFSLAIAAFLLVYMIYGMIMLGANGTGLERIFWAVIGWSVAALTQLVCGELLEGIVEFLIRNECRSEID